MKFLLFYTDSSITILKELSSEEVFQDGLSLVGVGSLITLDGKKRCVIDVVVREDGVVSLTIS